MFCLLRVGHYSFWLACIVFERACSIPPVAAPVQPIQTTRCYGTTIEKLESYVQRLLLYAGVGIPYFLPMNSLCNTHHGRSRIVFCFEQTRKQQQTQRGTQTRTRTGQNLNVSATPKGKMPAKPLYILATRIVTWHRWRPQ